MDIGQERLSRPHNSAGTRRYQIVIVGGGAAGISVASELDYDKTPRETFPFDQAKERWSLYLLKKHVLPPMYWHGLLKRRF